MWDYSREAADAQAEQAEEEAEEDFFVHMSARDVRMFALFFRVIGALAATCMWLGVFSLVWAFVVAWRGDLLATAFMLACAAANFYAAHYAWTPRAPKRS